MEIGTGEIMSKYSGSGWHFQHTRHSNARKYGKAGGTYLGLKKGTKINYEYPLNKRIMVKEKIIVGKGIVDTKYKIIPEKKHYGKSELKEAYEHFSDDDLREAHLDANAKEKRRISLELERRKKEWEKTKKFLTENAHKKSWMDLEPIGKKKNKELEDREFEQRIREQLSGK